MNASAETEDGFEHRRALRRGSVAPRDAHTQPPALHGASRERSPSAAAHCQNWSRPPPRHSEQRCSECAALRAQIAVPASDGLDEHPSLLDDVKRVFQKLLLEGRVHDHPRARLASHPPAHSKSVNCLRWHGRCAPSGRQRALQQQRWGMEAALTATVSVSVVGISDSDCDCLSNRFRHRH